MKNCDTGLQQITRRIRRIACAIALGLAASVALPAAAGAGFAFVLFTQ
jgi:hypothetical protein